MADIQLASKNHIDEYLTEDPEISFFRPNYKRFSNFSIETVKLNIEGIKNFGSDNFIKLYRDHDMINKIYLQITLPQLNAKSNNPVWVPNVGHKLIEESELVIGGKLIDKHNSVWNEIYQNLTLPNSKKEGYTNMIAHNGTSSAVFSGSLTVDTGLNITTVGQNNIVSGSITKTNIDIFRTGVSSIDDYKIILTESQGIFVSCSFTSSSTFRTTTGNIPLSSGSITNITLLDSSGNNIKNYDNTNSVISLSFNQTNNINLDFNGCVVGDYVIPAKTLYIPFNFFFNKFTNHSLPIIALQYHDVKIKYKIENFSKLITNDAYYQGLLPNSLDIQAFGDYIILNKQEREKNYFNPHHLNIEYLQHFGELRIDSGINHQFSVALHNCVKEIFIVAIKDNNVFGDFSVNNTSPIENIEFLCNGLTRLKNTDSKYFNLVQKYQHHTSCTPNKFIYSYSFGLEPEKELSTGTYNFSAIDNFKVKFKMNPNFGSGKIMIYATSFNRLLIQHGITDIKFTF